MNRTAKLFWTVVAAQVVFLLAWAGWHEWVRQHTDSIVLRCAPVDPQDLLRGDYMTLRYDISEIGDIPGETPEARSGREVWVLLEKRGRHHVIAQASWKQLTPKAGQVLVRGETAFITRGASAGPHRISYGIERYFVPEGKGTPRFQLIEAEATVSPAHRLYLRRVLLDGQPYP